MQNIIKFRKEDYETKRMFRFEEVTADGNLPSTDDRVIGKLYVHKRIFDGNPPPTFTVTLTWEA